MPEEEKFRTHSADTRCSVCRRTIYHDPEAMTMKHWSPKIDKDHAAIIEVAGPPKHNDMRKWFER